MRPGYDRVHSDTRRAPIPDLPVKAKGDLSKEPSNRAFITMGTVLAILLVIGLGIAYLFTTAHTPRTSPLQTSERPLNPR
jgi:hypothetical protein